MKKKVSLSFLLLGSLLTTTAVASVINNNKQVNRINSTHSLTAATVAVPYSDFNQLIENPESYANVGNNATINLSIDNGFASITSFTGFKGDLTSPHFKKTQITYNDNTFFLNGLVGTANEVFRIHGNLEGAFTIFGNGNQTAGTFSLTGITGINIDASNFVTSQINIGNKVCQTCSRLTSFSMKIKPSTNSNVDVIINENGFESTTALTDWHIETTIMTRINLLCSNYAFANTNALANEPYWTVTNFNEKQYFNYQKTSGMHVFENSAITSWNMGANSTLDVISHNYFDRCQSLSEVNLTSSIVEISEFSFRKCSALTSINIPSSITTFKLQSFLESGLNSITFNYNINQIKNIILGANIFKDLVGGGNLTIHYTNSDPETNDMNAYFNALKDKFSNVLAESSKNVVYAPDYSFNIHPGARTSADINYHDSTSSAVFNFDLGGAFKQYKDANPNKNLIVDLGTTNNQYFNATIDSLTESSANIVITQKDTLPTPTGKSQAYTLTPTICFNSLSSATKLTSQTNLTVNVVDTNYCIYTNQNFKKNPIIDNNRDGLWIEEDELNFDFEPAANLYGNNKDAFLNGKLKDYCEIKNNNNLLPINYSESISGTYFYVNEYINLELNEVSDQNNVFHIKIKVKDNASKFLTDGTLTFKMKNQSSDPISFNVYNPNHFNPNADITQLDNPTTVANISETNPGVDISYSLTNQTVFPLRNTNTFKWLKDNQYQFSLADNVFGTNNNVQINNLDYDASTNKLKAQLQLIQAELTDLDLNATTYKLIASKASDRLEFTLNTPKIHIAHTTTNISFDEATFNYSNNQSNINSKFDNVHWILSLPEVYLKNGIDHLYQAVDINDGSNRLQWIVDSNNNHINNGIYIYKDLTGTYRLKIQIIPTGGITTSVQFTLVLLEDSTENKTLTVNMDGHTDPILTVIKHVYTPSRTKTSIAIIIIAILASLITLGGVGFGLYCYYKKKKNKKSKDESNNSVPSVSVTTNQPTSVVEPNNVNTPPDIAAPIDHSNHP